MSSTEMLLAEAPRAPPADARRYWEASTKTWLVQVMPDDFYVSRRDEVISTILGSCVAACMRDAEVGVGGINHFLLPEAPRRAEEAPASTRYGFFALERLINSLLRLGARRDRLEIKIFGGGRVLPDVTAIGPMNVQFVREYLKNEGMTIVAEDVGQAYARRLRYHPLSGQARVLRLPMGQSRTVAVQEKDVARRLVASAEQGGEVELFVEPPSGKENER